VLPLNYSASVAVAGQCQDNQENALAQVPELMSVLQNPKLHLPANCSVFVAQYLCVTAYPSCRTNLAPPCATMCGDIEAACAPVLPLLLNFLPGGKLTCAAADSPLCYAPPSAAEDPSYRAVVPSPPRCASYAQMGGKACEGIVEQFYLPKSTPFAYLESSANSLRFLYNFIGIDSDSGRDCYRAFTRQLCTNLFQGCTDALMDPFLPENTTMPIPFPRFMCRDECEDYTRRCALPPAVVGQLPLLVQQILAPNCSSVGAKLPAATTCNVTNPGSVAKPDFPEVATTFVVSGIPVPLQAECSAMGANRTAAIAVVAHCPYPLLTPNRPQDAIAGTAWSVHSKSHGQPIRASERARHTGVSFMVAAVLIFSFPSPCCHADTSPLFSWFAVFL